MGLKNLVVTGTCLNHQRTVVFSEETFPNMRIVDAVAISMTIPLYFRAIFIDDKGKVYRNIYDRDSLHVMVDGGVLANYPIYLFDGYRQQLLITKHKADPHTLGFRIDSQAQIKQDSLQENTLAPRRIEKLSDYIGALYNVTGETLNRYPLTQEDWDRTISIPSKGIGPRIKKLSLKERLLLYNSGKEATRRYLDKRIGTPLIETNTP
jgi:NTE family protein